MMNLEKDAAVRLLVLVALVWVAVGCQVPPKAPPPLTTVQVGEQVEVATPAPLPDTPAPPPPVLADPAANVVKGWPTNWINSWIPLESWAQLNRLPKPVLVPSNPHPIYEFRTPERIISVKIGSRVGQWNGLEYWLGFAPQIVNSLPY